MLAVKYINELISYGKQAIKELDKEELTTVDIQKALGSLDIVKHELEAAQILLREEYKELRDKENGQHEQEEHQR